MKTLRLLLLLGCLSTLARAQELNCTVTVNMDQLAAQQKVDLSYVNQLQGLVAELMNNRRWSNDQFTAAERINCSLNINLVRSTVQGAFQATAQINVTRPVYGTSYQTTVFSYVDRSFDFVYQPTIPVNYRENVFNDDLTSMLAFYANIILAVDYDSFSKRGGSAFVQKAYTIATLAQQAGNSNVGWQAGTERRNRYWLIENMQNQQLIPFRDGFYTYHRLGLDAFAANPVQVRKQTLDLLATIRTIGLQLPNSVLLNSFFDAKSQELLNILYEGQPAERKRAFELLSYLDPAKTEAYRKLVQ